MLANTFEEMPNRSRSRDAESAREADREPHEPVARFTLAQFPGAQAHPKLRAAGEPLRQGNGRRPHRAKGFLRLARERSAPRAILQMCAEPFALGLRYSFDVLLRDHFFRASIHFPPHLT